MTSVRTVAACCLALAWQAAEVGAQTSGVNWPTELSESDRRDILALAKQIGIARPEKVDIGRVMILGDRYVVVASAEVENGHELRRSTVDLARLDWHEYDHLPAERRAVRSGNWFVKGRKEELVKWRIRDGAWSHDVGFSRDDDAVTYDSAEKAVLAIRRQTLTNRQAERIAGDSASQPPIPPLDASRIYWIRKPFEPFQNGDQSGVCQIGYQTGEYTGLYLIVRVTAEGVELLEVHSYII